LGDPADPVQQAGPAGERKASRPDAAGAGGNGAAAGVHSLDRDLSGSHSPPDRGVRPGAGEPGAHPAADSHAPGAGQSGYPAMSIALDLSTPGGMTAALAPELTLSAWAMLLTLYAGVR